MNELNVSSFPVDVTHVIGKDDSRTDVTAGDRYFKRVTFGLTRCRTQDAKSVFSVVTFGADHKGLLTTSLFMAGRRTQRNPDKVASLCLITPAYFAKYFTEDGRLNFEGELGLMLGIIALWALSLPAITTLPMMPKAIGGMRWKRSQRMGYLCLILVVAHMVAFGLRGWLSPEHWPWMLSPISLVAAIIAMIPLVVKFMK